MNNRRGATLLEILMAAAILGMVVLAIVRFLPAAQSMIRRVHYRSQANSEGRALIDETTRLLRFARPETVRISTPVTTPAAPPNSRIHFSTSTTLDSGFYDIYWSADPVYTVFIEPQGQPARPIATNVTLLSFTGDFRDPALVNISLRFDVPDGTGRIAFTTFFDRIKVRMGQTP